MICDSNTWWNNAITLPTPSTAIKVPIPIPNIVCANIKPIHRVIQTLTQSNIFFVRPTLLLNLPANAYTIPSPGFGTNCILKDMAAPTPVQIIAIAKISNWMPNWLDVGI